MFLTKKKDQKKRSLVYHLENNRIILKSIFYNQKLVKSIRWNAHLRLSNMLKNSSKTQLKNFCIISGRSKGITPNLKLSRIAFKKYVSLGYGAGLKKHLW